MMINGWTAASSVSHRKSPSRSLARLVESKYGKIIDTPLEESKNQIRHAKQMLHFYRQSNQKEVSRMFHLHRQNMRLSALVTQFKNNDEEYVKIRQIAKQAVRNALSNNRQLLKFALLSIIESLRVNPTKFDFVINGTSSLLTMSKSITIDQLGSNCHVKSFHHSNQNSYAETLIELIMNEAAILFEKMVKDFTNQTMTHAAPPGSNTMLLPSMIYLNEQTDSVTPTHGS
jgi:hypothetical protein